MKTRQSRSRRALWTRSFEGEGGDGGANGGAPAGGADGGDQGGAGGDAGNLFDGVDAGGAGKGAEGEGGKGEHDWIPEKYRVAKEDGSVDEAASARKLADAYRNLEQKLGKGAVLQAPATPDDYKITAPVDADGKPIEGLDVDAFMADPLFKQIAKGAHEKGIPNEHLQYFVQTYLTDIAPNLLAADQQLSLQEARAELSKIWTDDQTFNQNMQASMRAMTGFGAGKDDEPGSTARLMKKYGRDPDFVAFSARVGAEMAEDKLPSGHNAVGEVDVEALQKSEAYWKPEHPDHAATKAKVDAYYQRKFGNKAR